MDYSVILLNSDANKSRLVSILLMAPFPCAFKYKFQDIMKVRLHEAMPDVPLHELREQREIHENQEIESNDDQEQMHNNPEIEPNDEQ